MSLSTANAEDWYRLQAIGDDITYISEPFIKEFYRCNIWHVRGRDRDMLVDSGMGVVSLRQYVPQVTEKSCIAVASHSHFDHIGCHHEFEQRIIHAAEADIMATPTRASTLAEPYVTDDIFTQLPPHYSSVEYAVKQAPATRLVDNGDIIDLGGRHFEVIHTPGHSPGGIALWEEKTGVLFSGDTIYDGPLIEDCYHSDATDYYQSMKRLYDIPARIVHGGHFPSFSGERHRQMIREWLQEKDG